MYSHPIISGSVAIVIAILLTACGGGGGSSVDSQRDLDTTRVDTSDQLFDPNHLLKVAIEMDPDEFEVLRQEGRSVGDLFSGCTAGFEYSHFTARINVDGQVLENVDIRKKGFFGSLSAARPSIKLNVGTHVPGREIFSVERLTLNNNNQDPGNVNQCLSYDMFRAAGVPAPRCSFARVSVNGTDLGIYSNIESVKKRFLRRHFDDDEGNLYEIQAGGDFGELNKERFQLKTNEDVDDRSDLDLVVSALAADDVNMPALLDQVVDLDAFLTFWAMEAITGHWDSGTGNANNAFVYFDPSDGRFSFLPWGTDGAFALDSLLAPGSGPLYRYAIIPSRLYAIPEWRERFHNRVLELLDTVWDPVTANAEIDRMRDLTGTDEADLVAVRQFFDLQEQRIRDSIDGTLIQTERTIEDRGVNCNPQEPSRIRGTFSNGLVNYSYTDEDGQLVNVVGRATPPVIGGDTPFSDAVSMTLIGQSAQGLRIAISFVEEPSFGPGEIPFHGFATAMFLIGDNNGDFGVIGFTGNGSYIFDEPATLGEPISGSFEADLYFTGDGPGIFGGF